MIAPTGARIPSNGDVLHRRSTDDRAQIYKWGSEHLWRGHIYTRVPLQLARMNGIAALTCFVILEAIMIAQTVFAYLDHFLTVRQMHAQGIAVGNPFIWHFANLGDALIIAPCVSFIVGRYWSAWTWSQIAAASLLSLFVATAMHWLYLKVPYPGAHIFNHQLTRAGMLHFVFMLIALAFLILFFFWSDISLGIAYAVSVAIAMHVFLATQLAIGIAKLYYELPWYAGTPLRDAQGWATFLSVVAFLVLRLRALDLRSCRSVF